MSYGSFAYLYHICKGYICIYFYFRAVHLSMIIFCFIIPLYRLWIHDFGLCSVIYQDSSIDFVWAIQFIALMKSMEKYNEVPGRGMSKKCRWYEWCLIFLTKTVARMENDTPWIHCSDKHCNDKWYEPCWLHSHYTLQIVILSSEAVPILHWLLSLICFKNIFEIKGPLGEANNKNFKIDAGALILVTGQEEIFHLLVWKDISWHFNN